MSVFLYLILATASEAPPSVPTLTPRAEWRVCTLQSTIAQLKQRQPSLESDSVVTKAWADCARHLDRMSQTQSAEEIRGVQDQQRKLISQTIELLYWDNATGHI